MTVDSLFWQAEARFDWGMYVRDHGGVRALRSSPDEYLLTCPDCGKPKLAVNTAKRAWRCFTCSEGGRDAASLVAKVEHLPFGQSLIKVLTGHRAAVGRVDKIADEVERIEAPRRTWREMPWPEGWRLLHNTMTRETRPVVWGGIYGTYPPPPAPHQEEAVALAYCEQRGIPPYVITEMRLGVCVSGAMKDRLIFPCFDSGGRLIFYQGRATWAPRPRELRHIKVLSPRSEEGFAGPADCLLNLSYVAERLALFNRRCLLVEGPVDCAHAWPDAVATWGKKISPRQTELLIRAGVQGVDLCWDSDAVAEMMRVSPMMADLFDVRIVTLPPEKDPGDLSKEQIESCRANAARAGSGDRLARLP